MKVIGLLLRLFSYLFHLTLSVFLLGSAVIAGTSHQPLRLGMLPFTDESMVMGVFWLSIAGLLATLLALTRVFKFLFPLWAAAVVYLMFRGFLFSNYTFAGENGFKTASWLMLASVLALIGALWVLKPRRGRLYF